MYFLVSRSDIGPGGILRMVTDQTDKREDSQKEEEDTDYFNGANPFFSLWLLGTRIDFLFFPALHQQDYIIFILFTERRGSSDLERLNMNCGLIAY
jgi:hypothetical protein